MAVLLGQAIGKSYYAPPAADGLFYHPLPSPVDGTFKALTQFTTDLILDVAGYFAP